MSNKNEWKWRVSKKEAGQGLLFFLKEKCLEAPSVKAIKRAIDSKRCLVNGQINTFSTFVLSDKDAVSLLPDAFEVPQSRAFPILYEDEFLIVCNKAPGVSSEKASVRPHIPHFKGEWELVHRLDKETSGAWIIAKSSAVKKKMIAAFKELHVKKVYLALVDGTIKQESGKIDNFLGKVKSLEGQAIYASVPKTKGLRAVTLWKCVKKGKKASLVRCEPLTGRTHQLRVHLSGLGHPILGDVQYGKRFTCPLHPKRNLLHAYQLTFLHPQTQKEIKIVAPIPKDFKQAMEQLDI